MNNDNLNYLDIEDVEDYEKHIYEQNPNNRMQDKIKRDIISNVLFFI